MFLSVYNLYKDKNSNTLFAHEILVTIPMSRALFSDFFKFAFMGKFLQLYWFGIY